MEPTEKRPGRESLVLALIQALQKAVLGSEGATDRSTRVAAFAGESVDPSIDPYLENVREHSFKVLERDIHALRKAGRSEDAIFELTVAAALGAATLRLKARLAAVGTDA